MKVFLPILVFFIFLAQSLFSANHLPHKITTKDLSVIIHYDEYDRIIQIEQVVFRNGGYIDSTVVNYVYGVSGRINQQLKTTKKQNLSNGQYMRYASFSDYSYKQDTLFIKSKNTEVSSLNPFKQSEPYYTYIKKYKADKNTYISETEKRSGQEENDYSFEIKYNQERKLESYIQKYVSSNKYTYTIIYNILEYSGGKSVFGNVNFVYDINKNNFFELINPLLFDGAAKIQFLTEAGIQDKEEDISSVGYTYNDNGYPISINFYGSEDPDQTLFIDYIHTGG